MTEENKKLLNDYICKNTVDFMQFLINNGKSNFDATVILGNVLDELQTDDTEHTK